MRLHILFSPNPNPNPNPDCNPNRNPNRNDEAVTSLLVELAKLKEDLVVEKFRFGKS